MSNKGEVNQGEKSVFGMPVSFFLLLLPAELASFVPALPRVGQQGPYQTTSFMYHEKNN